MKLRSLLSLAALASLVGNFGYAADSDLTAQQKFDALKEKGIFAGMADGSAGLDKNMTRAQFARVAALLAGLNQTPNHNASSFTDVDANPWAVSFVGAAVAAGLQDGPGDSVFDPSAGVTVQQLAVVVSRLLGNPADDSSSDVGALFENTNGNGGLIAATSGQLRYTTPDGTVIILNTGDGALINEDGSLVEVTTLKALIELEAQNGTADNPGSLTSSLTTFLDQFAGKVAAGEYGDRGVTLLANVVETFTKTNPAAAITYFDTAVNAIADSSTMKSDEKKDAAGQILGKFADSVSSLESGSSLIQNALTNLLNGKIEFAASDFSADLLRRLGVGASASEGTEENDPRTEIFDNTDLIDISPSS